MYSLDQEITLANQINSNLHKKLTTQAAEIERLEIKWIQAIGWAYADCCATLDAGGDPRQTEMPDVLRRATLDLKESE